MQQSHMHKPVNIPVRFQSMVEERLSHLTEICRERGIAFYDDAGVAEHLKRVLLASDFAYESLVREPQLLGQGLIPLMSDPRTAEARISEIDPSAVTDEAQQMSSLRRFRRREAVRLIWRDVNGLDDVAATLSGASALAEACLETALNWSESLLIARNGTARNEAGETQRMVVLGLGKLGGNELNFSSDIDLIFAYPENGVTDGTRSLDNETFFTRLGQQLVRLLSEVTADGFVYRVDLRLRPFGSSGRLALSFNAMEQYYQREGRDWERYAWIKARPVAGDAHAGERLIETLRPFIYRRYLDYTAFAGLREMKALIDAEVTRKDLSEHLKLGPGGIREIEFIVQLLQLIRGGREPSVRVHGLLPALTLCEQRGWLNAIQAKRLRDGYLFLRQLENRLQMLRDEQTHELPSSEPARERYAAGLGYSDWAELESRLQVVRTSISAEFSALMAPTQARAKAPQAVLIFWQRINAGIAEVQELAQLGFNDTVALHANLVAIPQSNAWRGLSARARERCDRLMPQLLQSAAASAAPDACLDRLLRLVHAVLKRPSYLALLDEQPAARQRLVSLFATSGYLADRVIAHPLLLDELFDARLEAGIPDRSAIIDEITRRLALLEEADVETEIEILQEEKHSVGFRVGLAYLAGRIDAIAAARALSDLAEAVIFSILRICERDAIAQYGLLDGYSGIGTGLAVLGYGSLGGAELGFASDLDLVFIYDGALAQKESLGPKALDGARYYVRLGQRVMHLLTMPTSSGRLFEVDVRLRPDGGKGLLVINLQAFNDYQRERAWVWEHQALVRARFVAGDEKLGARFGLVRDAILGLPREPIAIKNEIGAMRVRWRAERDRSTVDRLDLKQGMGALLDIEFVLQALVLLHAGSHPELLASGNTRALISLLAQVGVLCPEQADCLRDAHRTLLAAALSCTLDARPRIAARTPELELSTATVSCLTKTFGLDFAAVKDSAAV